MFVRGEIVMIKCPWSRELEFGEVTTSRKGSKSGITVKLYASSLQQYYCADIPKTDLRKTTEAQQKQWALITLNNTEL